MPTAAFLIADRTGFPGKSEMIRKLKQNRNEQTSPDDLPDVFRFAREAKAGLSRRSEVNPYAPPDETSQPFQDRGNSRSLYRPGPVVPVAFGLLAGVFSGASGFLQQRVPHAFLMMMPIGAIIGGIYFRLRCRNRPADPTVKRHRLGSVICILSSLLAISAFLTVAGEGDGYILGSVLLTAVSMALGVLFSGNRR
jgi:hypothetical protein